MSEVARFAGRLPRSVLQDLRFWGANPRLVLAVLASLLTGTVLVGVAATQRGLLLVAPAVAIYLMVFWGLAVGARSLARLEVEHGIADTVNRRAVQWLRKVTSGEAPRPGLEQLEPQLVPANPASDVAVVRLFQHIINEAKDRRSSPGFLVMQPYREESYGALFRLQGIQRGALQLGILGTFVGLVMALTRLRPGTGGSLALGELGPLIGSLDVAFTTSIAGIAVSVILGFTMMVFRSKQESYFRSMEEATGSVASLARNAINKDEYLAELNQVQVAIHQLGDRILEQSQQTETQTSVLQAGVRRLVETKGQLDGFLDRLGEEQGSFLEEMQEVYEHLSPQRFAERLDERIEASMDGMLERWNRGIDASVGDLSKLGGSLREVIQVLERVEWSFLEEKERFQETAERSSETIRELSTSLDRVAQRQVEWLGELERAVPDNLDEILKNTVRRAFEASVGNGGRASASPHERIGVPPSSDELVAAFKAVGEVQYTMLRRIATEISSLRESMEGRRRSGVRLRGVRRWLAHWIRREWEQTVADFRSLARRIRDRIRGGGGAGAPHVPSEET